MNRERTISAFVTLIAMALIALWLVLAHLHWSPGKPWPPEPEPYIELAAEEFIEPEQIPLPPDAPGDMAAAAQLPERVDADSRTAPQTGTALVDAGKEATPAYETTQTKPSTVKVTDKPQPQKPGPATTKEAPKTSAARTQVADMFKRSQDHHNADNGNADKANSGKPDGKPDSAGPVNSNSVTSGVQKGRLGGGWQWPGYSRIPSSVTGSVVIEFTVNANGKAGNVKVVGGSAPAAANKTLCNRCIQELKSRTFTRPASAGAPDAETPATITFTFK